MQYLLISFIAGVLTVLAPCVFTLLPIILGGSLTGSSWKKPFVIILSLSLSVFIFTLLLKTSTLFINVDPNFWNYLSGGIIVFFGIFTFFPNIWIKIDNKLGLSTKADTLLHKASKKKNILGDILVGAALGPVFSSCSPTYAIIVATILPQNLFTGIINLVIYILGLALVLAIITITGQKLIKKASWAIDPNSLFKKILGILFIIIGLLIITGLDKSLEIYALDKGFFDVTSIETKLLNSNSSNNQNGNGNNTNNLNSVSLNVTPYPAPELTGITDWLNSQPLTMASLKGKVVLVDFWTYSCINCLRTLPYLNSWYDKYKADGLVIVGVHAPEFAFEHVKANVQKAVTQYGVKYPVAMDNNYGTWTAFNNQYWPATYFIDRSGNVVNTHFGEGDYATDEKVIQYLLGVNNVSTKSDVEEPFNANETPETYLGYNRFDQFNNINQFQQDETVNYSSSSSSELVNSWSLDGKWLISPEYILSESSGSKLTLNFSAKNVYLVMGASPSKTIDVKVFNSSNKMISEKTMEISDYKLYTVVSLSQFSNDFKVEITTPEGVQMNAFTFGS